MKTQKTNAGASVLEKTQAGQFRRGQLDRTRLLGWAVTLTGAALMVGGATVAFLSAF